MPAFQCICGKQYTLPDSAAGKKARCNACSRIFTVPLADAVAYELEPAPPPRAPEPVPPAIDDTASSAANVRAKHTPPRPTSFWRESLSGFLFFLKPWGLTVLIVLWFVAFIADIIPISLISWPIRGLIYAFYLQTINAFASGDDRLPQPGDFEGLWESVALPIIQFVGTTSILGAPALLALAALHESRPELASNLALTLAIIGAFLWPICILAVAIGGLGAFVRIDLLIRSILRALPAYLGLCTMLLGAIAIKFFLIYSSAPLEQADAVEHANALELLAHGHPGLAAWFIAAAIGALASSYADIVTMRAIGLFYKHFKDRFPWSAG